MDHDWHPFQLLGYVDGPLVQVHSDLSVDAMYFRSASVYLGIAVDLGDEITAQVDQVESDEMMYWLRGYDMGECIAFEQENMDAFMQVVGRLEETYSTLLQSLAAAHMFSAACLEAHINARSHELLKGSLRDEFERFSLEAKWLTLPSLVGVGEFDPGREPYQSFSDLVRVRNKLVHFKHTPRQWAERCEALTSLGLSVEVARRSVASAGGMVGELARMLSEDEPAWVGEGGARFFRLERVTASTDKSSSSETA